MGLTQRQIDILNFAVKNYLKTGIGASSFNLKKYFKESSPTIRNDLNFLEKKGFFKKEFFSSRRNPTTKALEFYIKKNILKNKKIEKKFKKEIKKILRQKEEKLENFLKDLSYNLRTIIFAFDDYNIEFYGLDNAIFILSQIEEERKNIKKVLKNLFYYIENQMLLVDQLQEFYKKELPEILIGKYLEITKSLNCSVILTKTKKGEREINLAFIGPRRINYEKIYFTAKCIKEINFSNL